MATTESAQGLTGTYVGTGTGGPGTVIGRNSQHQQGADSACTSTIGICAVVCPELSGGLGTVAVQLVMAIRSAANKVCPTGAVGH
jgi:hypothetical protein